VKPPAYASLSSGDAEGKGKRNTVVANIPREEGEGKKVTFGGGNWERILGRVKFPSRARRKSAKLCGDEEGEKKVSLRTFSPSQGSHSMRQVNRREKKKKEALLYLILGKKGEGGGVRPPWVGSMSSGMSYSWNS